MNARQANTHLRRVWRTATAAVAPSTDRSIRLCVGAAHESEAGFVRASPYRGDIRGAQDAADHLAEGQQAWVHDVMNGDSWARMPGEAWRQVVEAIDGRVGT